MPSIEPTAKNPAHLLIVDDEADVVDLLNRYFSSHGYRVSTSFWYSPPK